MRSEQTRTTKPWRAPECLRRRSERGAALVEAAIVFIPLCIIVFGIIEYGFVFKDSLTLSSATRAGARTASAEPRQTNFMNDAVAATARAAVAGTFKPGVDQMWIYKADANGAPADGCPSTTCSVYKYSSTLDPTTKTNWVHDQGSWDPTKQVACLGSTATDSVGIRVTLQHKAISGWFTDLPLHERTVMRLEPLDQNCS